MRLSLPLAARLPERRWLAALVVTAAAALTLVLLFLGARWAWRTYYTYRFWQGLRLNQTAWEAGYLERRLPLPPDGPRDGYWGSRIGSHTVDPQLGWVLPALRIPGLLETDARGMQHVMPAAPPQLHLLIVGASTAFGGYASSIERTYFHQLARRLEAAGLPVEVTVYATGAWKSVQEVAALRLHGLALRPDAVLFLNGLNDITNGSNARALYGEATETLDGSRWHPLYHEHDYGARVRTYLANMEAAYEELRGGAVPLIVALQPALFEKAHLSTIEARVQRESLVYYGPREQLAGAYATLRARLAEAAARTPGMYFIDCSRAFDEETATVFTDMWHFSDPGHEILARALADPLARILRPLAKPAASASLSGR